MTMPKDLVLVRHGESEGNVLKKRAERGDFSGFTDEFRARHSSKFRLSDKGIAQAKAAGEWLRAKETAGLLGLELGAVQRWYADFALRERDYGLWDTMSFEERSRRFEDYVRHQQRDGKYWMPPGGESLAEVALRFGRILDT